MVSLPKKEVSDSQARDVVALRPLKELLRGFWELNLKAQGFDCGNETALWPREQVVPMEKVAAADVAAISQTLEDAEGHQPQSSMRREFGKAKY